MKSTKKFTPFKVKDLTLAKQGEQNIAWAARQMGALSQIKARFEREKPLTEVTVGLALHVTKETANLVETLRAGGAAVAIAGCNPLSTQDDVAAALARSGVRVYAWKGQTKREYYVNLERVIDALSESKTKYLVTVDDGLDLVTLIYQKHPRLLGRLTVGTEETTTGVVRLQAMTQAEALRYPIIAVNDNQTKHLFDNYYGTGQSTIDGILRATNVLLAGKTVVIAGYGDCGKGVARRASGMGAMVIVSEANPVRALQAQMDGFRLMPMLEAARVGDIFITVTGNKQVITSTHVKRMKDGAILANAGHFDLEIDVQRLRQLANGVRQVRPGLESLTIFGKSIFLLGEGRLVNLACGEGHPSEVMDLSFAGQALAIEYGVFHSLPAGLHRLPTVIDQTIAKLKLQAMGLTAEQLTRQQQRYLSSWQEGT